MNSEELKKKLMYLGCHEIHKKHKYIVWENIENGNRTTIPNNKSNINSNLVRKMCNDLGLEPNEFEIM